MAEFSELRVVECRGVLSPVLLVLSFVPFVAGILNWGKGYFGKDGGYYSIGVPGIVCKGRAGV